MYQDLLDKKKKLGVIGLGYVGLPIALQFSKKLSVIGYNFNEYYKLQYFLLVILPRYMPLRSAIIAWGFVTAANSASFNFL